MSYPWSAGDLLYATHLNYMLDIGGDGSDGALDTSGGVVDINLGGARFVVKNYTSMNVATNNLTFSNPHANGTLVILKSQGNVVISATIDLTSIGGAKGAGGAGSGAAGADGIAAHNWATFTQDGSEIEGQNGINNGAGGAGGVKGAGIFFAQKSLALHPGSGGGGGGSGDNAASTGGAGGDGAGALLIECKGDLNFTGTIIASGDNGSNGTYGGTENGGGGGGGGTGGSVVIIYKTLTSKAGTININGGNGGNGGSGNGVDQGGSGGGGAGSGISAGGAGGAGSGGAGVDGSDAAIGGTKGSGAANAGGGGGGGGASGWYAIIPYADVGTT